MKTFVRLSLLTAIVSSLCVLNACSWFSDPDEVGMDPYSGSASGKGGLGNGFGDGSGGAFGPNSGKDEWNTNGGKGGANDGMLGGRPGSDWTPIPGVNLEPVYFGFDQYNIESSETAKLQAAADYLKGANSNTVGIIIDGNCDERGSAEYNMGLGERRALASRDYLVSLGIADSRIQTLSYGSERPAVQGHDEAAWAKNRRDGLTAANMK